MNDPTTTGAVTPRAERELTVEEGLALSAVIDRHDGITRSSDHTHASNDRRTS